jgi:hypothetical protein
MIFYLAVIIGTALSSCFVGKLDFELDDNAPHERRSGYEIR